MDHVLVINKNRVTVTTNQLKFAKLEPIPGRNKGDVQISLKAKEGDVCLHIHQEGSNAGAMSFDGTFADPVDPVPLAVSDIVRQRPDYARTVASCKTAHVEDTTSTWRRASK